MYLQNFSASCEDDERKVRSLSPVAGSSVPPVRIFVDQIARLRVFGPQIIGIVRGDERHARLFGKRDYFLLFRLVPFYFWIDALFLRST